MGKALAFHNWLIQHVEYDYDELKAYWASSANDEPRSHYDIGAFVYGKAVCEGYAKAYRKLLNQAGIENRYALTNIHMWNKVKIDGSWYNVDVTLDDEGSFAGMSYKHFLINDDERLMLDTGSDNKTSGDSRQKSTIYSNSFWRNLKSPICNYGRSWYWTDYDEEKSDKYTDYTSIMKYDTVAKKKSRVYTFETAWTVADKEGYVWPGSYTSIGIYNNRIYFNTPTQIKSIDPNGKNVKTILKPKRPEGCNIYGMEIEGNKLRFSMMLSPNHKDKLYFKSIEGQIC